MDDRKIVDRLSRVGIFGNVLLAAFKLLAGIFGRSGAMVSDAVHSLSDVFATLIAWIGVRMARRAEDAQHPYGHERFECVASLILGLILAGTGLGIGWSGVRKLLWERGSLEVGKVADMVILSADPYAIPSGEIKDLRVEKLILGGEDYRSAKRSVAKAFWDGMTSKSKAC